MGKLSPRYVGIAMVNFMLCLLLSGCATLDALQLVYGNQYASHEWTDETKQTTLELEYLNEHTIVTASVNGVGDLRLVLDTGAAATVLFETDNTQSFLTQLNSKIQTGGIGEGDQTDVYFMHDTDLRLGALQISGLTTLFIKAKDNPMFVTPELAYIDGVIGYDVFSRFVTDINFTEKSVRIAEELIAPDSRYQRLPLQVKNNLPYVDLSISDNERTSTFSAILDTGGIGPLLLASGQGIPVGKILHKSAASGLGGETTVTANRVTSIEIGSYSIPNAIVAVSENSSSSANHILGTGVINRFNMIIDYKREELFLATNEHFAKPDRENVFGARLFPHTKGAYVLSTRPDTPVLALGLKVGDVIERVNGEGIHYGNFDAVNHKLSHLDEVEEICFRRNNSAQCTEVNL